MTARRTLWEFLDTADSRPAIVDTSDEEESEGLFLDAVPRSGVRWRVAATAGIGLAFVIALIAVGVFLFRPVAPELTVIAPEENTVDVDTPLEPAPSVTTVLVHVVGAVGKPGVVEVPADSRVIDAISEAGGASEDASLEGVNLARVVFDGEQIIVPRVGEESTVSETEKVDLISISRANSEELQTLPRVGPATAERIIAWREAHGPFQSVEDLLAVSGIGPATLEGFRHLITP